MGVLYKGPDQISQTPHVQRAIDLGLAAEVVTFGCFLLCAPLRDDLFSITGYALIVAVNIMCLQTKGVGKVSFTINAADQVYKQTIEFVYLGGGITPDRNLSIEITRRLQRAWACFQRYKMEI